MKGLVVALVAVTLIACSKAPEGEVGTAGTDSSTATEIRAGNKCDKKADFAYEVADYKGRNSFSDPYTPDRIEWMVQTEKISRQQGKDMLRIQQIVEPGMSPLKARETVTEMCNAGQI